MRFAATHIVLAALLTAAPVWGHGVRHRTSEEGTALRVVYDDGSPMAFCETAVYAPGKGEDAFQTGTTDRNGGFAFLPDTNGTWSVTVDDGMGHMVTAHIDVTPEGLANENAARPADRLSGVIVGTSVVFGIFGLWALFANRRKPIRSTSSG